MILDDLQASPREATPTLRGTLESGWSYEVHHRAEAIPTAWWLTLFPVGWKDCRYYQTLEKTFAGQFEQFYLVLKDGGGQARALQPCFFVEQDLTISLPRPLQVCLQPVKRHLQARLLMVGCIVSESDVGAPPGPALTVICDRLKQAISLVARHEGVSIIVFKDFAACYRPSLHGRGGYTRLPSQPSVQLALNFDSFEDYLQLHLGRATRKSLRRKFRTVDALHDPIRMEVKTRISAQEATVLHALYEQVARRGDLPFEVFNAAYFQRLGERMPEHARFFIWTWRGRTVAFSFCTVCGDTIYDNDLGMDDALAHSLHLYHVTFRDIFRWALAQGLQHYHSSPSNYAPKLHLGMSLRGLDLYVRHRSPVINTLLHWFAPLAAPTRREPLLHQFLNAADLH